MRKKVVILGSTGSIGVNTLRVLEANKDAFEVAGLAAGSRVEELAAQIESHRPGFAYIDDPGKALSLERRFGSSVRVFTKKEGMAAFVRTAGAEILVVGTSGTASLQSVLETLDRGGRVALANKEILVAAGGLVMSRLRAHKDASLIPVDSEHNAIFQCLEGHPARHVERIILTSSGGPLREIPKESFATLSRETVINHPRWKMGEKISVDSATMMNKGLEVIEAHWLFGTPIERIQVLVHPEAVVHSMVEFKDGSILAQLGVTDMRLPIAHALCYPERLSVGEELRIDWKIIRQLTFSEPDTAKFPCLELAYEAAKQSGTAPCVMSAADEVAVGAFLDNKIHFTQIPSVIEKVLSRHSRIADPDLSQIET
ncbi:MAG TPA: 1-deoxy-D-xylulose-5-phosphate reductoisomerase, partial [Candidatus Omnitrophota bacterium]|nr:1-deoxy-D-xylulose-5-phosphate reductoisomerase [Candidatus Omnitrophota bacterium]